MIVRSSPFSTEKNIGKALNEYCASIKDEWILITDGDSMFLTPDWGNQIKDVISIHGDKYDLFGCVTNRLGRNIQVQDEALFNEFDIRIHMDLAFNLEKEKWAEVEDITRKKYVAGLFMLFRKSLWEEVKFEENNFFDDHFSKAVVKRGGKLGLIRGLYVFHLYRAWADKNPRMDRRHL